MVASGVVKRYGPLVAVDDVSLSVRRGEFFGILGPNGAGKTTLLEIIEGLRKPDAGTVTVLGLPSWPRDQRLLGRIGVQLQASSFFERLTAGEQLRTFCALYGRPASRATELLELVGLQDKAGVRAEKLSGGQAQRLSIACALVHDPEVVFLDEPTGALDPQARRNLWDLLRAINTRGATVVLTTHSMEEAQTLCDRVAILDGGRVLQLGTPAELIRALDAPVRISLAPGVLSGDGARELVGPVDAEVVVEQDGAGTALVTRRPAPVLAALARADALTGLQVQGANLEDVFLALTGREYRA
ncbi:ABC transporter ATP-binding protein [Nakamurella flavida]|uniref:ABC transporter ATP-binding protein n=1 Tax=Nakamurella flavida TaxID=363630 RepID=A0A938YKE5_9ACTN|nr:ABC transporter ATP-binding protein [Nakamurella flavida]